MKRHSFFGVMTAIVVMLAATAIASADASTATKDPAPARPPISPQNAEFFQLTFPLASKPQQTANVIYNSILDHTPPFYNSSYDHSLVPYTGEYVYTASPSGANACGTTSQSREYCYNGHPGYDIRAASGTPVYAAHAGAVETAGTFGCYGTHVVLKDVDNPQFYTLYGHLSRLTVSSGDRVARGQLIGYSGNSGCSTGPHLHFGLYYNAYNDIMGNVLDPYGWFSQLPNNLGAPVTDYKWASGYAADTSANEPQNWNLGAIIANSYRRKDRTVRTPQSVGTAPNPTVDPIESWWANNYGSAGAPYNPVTNDCQDFEGGTYCRNGAYYFPFQDAPINFWAHRYIGWSNVEGIITGYPCGQRQWDPCVPPDNKPYFEPTRTATRGQFSKMAYIGLSMSPNMAGAPHFCDVPTNDTFYTYIETLYNNGAFTGYSGPSCGYSSTYFRPGENVTRGQATKIIANTATAKGWLSGYGSGGGPDFWDVPTDNTFYSMVEQLYNAGVVQYRVESLNRGGQGGQYYPDTPATRAEIAMYLHELIYAVAPVSIPSMGPK